jgi:hypothetical protein
MVRHGATVSEESEDDVHYMYLTPCFDGRLLSKKQEIMKPIAHPNLPLMPVR